MNKLLIIDDNPNERTLAAEACRQKGIECVVCDPGSDDWKWFQKMREVDAIVTDLFWASNMSHPAMKGREPPPSGLLVAIHGLALGKPVVICTNAATADKSWGHHGAAIGWIHGGYVKHMIEEDTPHQQPLAFAPESGQVGIIELPFGWQEDKNWDAAIDKALARIE